MKTKKVTLHLLDHTCAQFKNTSVFKSSPAVMLASLNFKKIWGRLLVSQSTYIYRAPQCMSLHWNWDSPTPLAASECALPPGPKSGGTHSPAAKGVGESQFQRLEKRLALCLLCDQYKELYFIGRKIRPVGNAEPTSPPPQLANNTS